MTSIPFPAKYKSIEELSNWLKRNLPHEFDVDGTHRWYIVTETSKWQILFVREHDATFFNLKWPH